jgi:ribosomal protein S18 acetylase RimI-like enzyme
VSDPAGAGVSLRRAGVADLDEVFPRTRALNAHEGIALTEEGLRASLRELLATPALGGVWLVERGGVCGYAIVTYCFDLEFGGREGWLTELWIDDAHRGAGAGTAVLQLLDTALRAEGVRALHLQVRPQNPAVRLYQRLGFTITPRHVMTRRMI